ncbi:MAG: NAD(P)-dependent alcohol dehydrogenase [Pseudomonadota bacterium]
MENRSVLLQSEPVARSLAKNLQHLTLERFGGVGSTETSYVHGLSANREKTVYLTFTRRIVTFAWTLRPGEGWDGMRQQAIGHEELKPHEARVAIHANSINARDIMIARGQSPLPAQDTLIPLSDGAGEVIELGSDVSRLKVGDRVVSTFNPAHLEGPYLPEMEPSALGAVAQGVLAEEVVLPASALAVLPDAISFETAACLPCAGVVAWNALFESGSVLPGQEVFATGTGAVSLIAMRLAHAAGARFGLSSSSDEKLKAAEELGADYGVNYRSTPHWEQAVLEATEMKGADIVLENAGPPSIAASIRALAQGGRVAQIGFSAPSGPPINVLDLMLKSVTIRPVMVGSLAMLERLIRAVSVNHIAIPIKARFSFDDARDAFNAASSPDGLGKVVISRK